MAIKQHHIRSLARTHLQMQTANLFIHSHSIRSPFDKRLLLFDEKREMSSSAGSGRRNTRSSTRRCHLRITPTHQFSFRGIFRRSRCRRRRLFIFRLRAFHIRSLRSLFQSLESLYKFILNTEHQQSASCVPTKTTRKQQIAEGNVHMKQPAKVCDWAKKTDREKELRVDIGSEKKNRANDRMHSNDSVFAVFSL